MPFEAKSPVSDSDVPTTIGPLDDELLDEVLDEVLLVDELPHAAKARLAAASVNPPRRILLRPRRPC
jgi:hypothetical protein